MTPKDAWKKIIYRQLQVINNAEIFKALKMYIKNKGKKKESMLEVENILHEQTPDYDFEPVTITKSMASFRMIRDDSRKLLQHLTRWKEDNVIE